MHHGVQLAELLNQYGKTLHPGVMILVLKLDKSMSPLLLALADALWWQLFQLFTSKFIFL